MAPFNDNKPNDMVGAQEGNTSLLAKVVPFHPLSFRHQDIFTSHAEACINLSAMDRKNNDLIDGFRKLIKLLLDGWQRDSTITEYHERWHNLIVSVSRDFSLLINAHPHNAVETADAFCLSISQLIKCMELEATNHRPTPYTPDQVWMDWFESCEKQKERAVLNVLYGPIPKGSEGITVHLHRRRLIAIASLSQFVYEQYLKHLPKHFEPRCQLLPSYYVTPPIGPISVVSEQEANGRQSLSAHSVENSKLDPRDSNVKLEPYLNDFSTPACDELAEAVGFRPPAGTKRKTVLRFAGSLQGATARIYAIADLLETDNRIKSGLKTQFVIAMGNRLGYPKAEPANTKGKKYEWAATQIEELFKEESAAIDKLKKIQK